jgi:hypothetical protein
LDRSADESKASATLDVPKKLRFCVTGEWRETTSETGQFRAGYDAGPLAPAGPWPFLEA